MCQESSPFVLGSNIIKSRGEVWVVERMKGTYADNEEQEFTIQFRGPVELISRELLGKEGRREGRKGGKKEEGMVCVGERKKGFKVC